VYMCNESLLFKEYHMIVLIFYRIFNAKLNVPHYLTVETLLNCGTILYNVPFVIIYN
jgi:hypothetical protein